MININKKIVSSIMIIFIMTMILFGINPRNDIEAREVEFRGIWVATVWGIDYPTQQTREEETLKREAIQMLDKIKDMGFNAVFLQVRSCADAIYDSEIFPWSKYLTGKQGTAPENNFDPLKFFIEESHKRGIELHAWINPYRVTASAEDNGKLTNNNPAVINSNITVLHSDGKLYLNPGEPEPRELIIDGIKEIMNNYDVDGIHLDDYFYPGKEFDDSETYAKYGAGFNDINEWRIHNNNILIKEIGETVHNIKSNAKFGVSPAGIWANKTTSDLGSDTYGWGTYDNQFADSRFWVKESYVDYIIPQIYWPIGYRIADYEKLVKWWSDVVKDTGVKLYIGQAAYKAVGAEQNSEWYNGQELEKQIQLNRISNNVSGYCMYSYSSFIKNKSIYSKIKELNNEELIEPISYENYEYHQIDYDLSPNENKDFAVMYHDDNGNKNILSRSSYINGKVVGLSNKKGNFGVMYNEPEFNDISGSSAEENIKYMAARNILLGYDGGGFHPDSSIKRADFILMLIRMLEINNIEGLKCFDDVSKGSYYFNELATAKKYGLIYGVGNNKFNPESEITLQNIYVMTYRAMDRLNLIESDSDKSNIKLFVDYNLIADYAEEAISYFAGKEIIKGDNGILNPTKIANRAETADFLATLLKTNFDAALLDK